MKFNELTGYVVAAAVAVAWSAPTLADGAVEDRLATLESRIKYLENRVAAQDEIIAAKERELSALSAEDAWFNRVEIGGVLELELVNEDPGGVPSDTGADIATAELAIAVAINETVTSEIVLARDDDDGIELDTATVTFEPSDVPLAVTVGKQGVPFGVYDTNLISDPLTLVLGETTGEKALVLGGEAGSMSWSVFGFPGENEPEEDHVASFGGGVGWASGTESSEISLSLSWISHIGESDTLRENSYSKEVSGASASLAGRFGAFSTLFEYVTATGDFPADELAFNGHGASPSALNIEAGYDFNLGGNDATIAIGFSSSEEAESAGLDETLLRLGVSGNVSENVGLGVEWSRSEGYGEAEEANKALTLLLGVEF